MSKNRNSRANRKLPVVPETPHAFKHENYAPGAPMLRGEADGTQNAELLAMIAEHVIGHKITAIEFTRELDEEASKEHNVLVDNLDISICLDNNVAYVCRIVVHSLAVVSRAEALAHIDPDQEPSAPATDGSV